MFINVSVLFTVMWIMKAGQWEVALDLLGEMKATGVQANEVTYSILFDILAAAGQWQRALHLFMTLDREGKGRASDGYHVRQS
jgi:pentatricopeptide repeat protein